MAEHNREADVDEVPPSGEQPTDALMAEQYDEVEVDEAPPSEKPSTDALLSAESARLPLTIALLQVTEVSPSMELLATLTPVLVNVRRTIGASCFECPKECSPEFTLSWLSAGIAMPLSSRRSIGGLHV